ncbi:MAG TPA: hypothetical protein VK661_03290 [Planctomycetota bacterium]|nr:hypothetical protein [Planctomycetota bacterium]
MAVGLLALLSLSATQQQQQQGSIIWAKSWAEAVKEATARNVPICFTIHKDG